MHRQSNSSNRLTSTARSSGGNAPGQSAGAASDAVALQHHFASQLGLAVRMPRIHAPSSNKVPASSKSGTTKQPAGTGTSASLYASTSSSASAAILTKLAQKWECDSCRSSNTASASQCSMCGRDRSLEKMSSKGTELTLAQARGLVPGPAPSLSDFEWGGIEARLHARGGDICPICMDALGMREAVMTSCTHLFHKACLDSLDRFTAGMPLQPSALSPTPTSTGGLTGPSVQGRALEKPAPQCPICRTHNYQRKRTRVAAHAYVQKCVAKVQALHRGRVTRRRYFEIRKLLYLGRAQPCSSASQSSATTAKDSNRRRAAFVAEALEDLHKRLKIREDTRNSRVSAAISDIDDSLAAARRVMAHATATFSSRSSANTGSNAGALTPSSSATPTPSATGTAAAARPASTGSEGGSDSTSETATRLLEILSERLQLVEARQRRLATTRQAIAQDLLQQQEQQRARAAADADKAALLDSSPPPRVSEAEWIVIRRTAGARGHASGDCPVCIMPLELELDSEGSDVRGPASSSLAASALPTPHAPVPVCRTATRGQSCSCGVLLSCGHVFHAACIGSLEKFSAGRTLPQRAQHSHSHSVSGDGDDKPPWPRCPLCRSKYWKAPFQHG